MGVGPEIQIKILPVGSVTTNFESKFESAGINQTLHKIYLDVACKVTIVMPYESIEADIVNQVLMTESVIVGEIPEAYYNLDGITSNNILDVVE